MNHISIAIREHPHFFLFLFLLSTFSCSPSGGQERESPSDVPWDRSSPSEEGVSQAVIESIHQEILDGQYGLVDRFLLIRNGKIIVDHCYEQDYDSVMEQYDTTNYQYNYDHTAWHPYYRDTRLHTLQSVTKSITSLLMGIAIDEGLIPNVEVLALPYFESYQPDSAGERKASLTIEDLLTMRSGFQWDEANYDLATNSCILMENSNDWIDFVLQNPMDEEPGTHFEYNSGASVLLGKIVREATGKRIDKWAEEKLFGPLDIQDYYWKVTPKGEIDTEGGLYLSTYDLAKIGYLMLHNGNWEGQQIVSSEWVEASLAPTVIFNEQSGYGYQWWVPLHEEGKTRIFAGNGYGGQFLMVAPEYDMLVVFNGWQIHGNPEKSTWRVFQDRILTHAKP